MRASTLSGTPTVVSPWADVVLTIGGRGLLSFTHVGDLSAAHALV